MSQALINGIADGSLIGLLAFAIVLVYRVSGVLSFAHAQIGSTAVVLGLVIAPRSLQLSAALAVVLGALIALAFERGVVARLETASRVSVSVATIGLSIVLIGVHAKVQGTRPLIVTGDPGSGMGPSIFGTHVDQARLLALGVLAIVGICFAVWLRVSDLGLALVAVSRDRLAARMVGLPASLLSALVWAISGALATIAVLLIGRSLGSAQIALVTPLFVQTLTAAVLGGLERPFGALVGGVAVGVIGSVTDRIFSSDVLPGISTLALTALLVVALIARPRVENPFVQ